MKNVRSVAIIGFALLPFASYGQTQGFLENPQPNSNQSGISVMSGWHCDAGVIEMQIDGGRFVPVPYGSERKDTEAVCGDRDNGFVFLLNYSGMGDGWHTINMYADGSLFGSANFQVTTFGGEFLTGYQGSASVNDFPNPGDNATLVWSEEKQSFVLLSRASSSDGMIALFATETSFEGRSNPPFYFRTDSTDLLISEDSNGIFIELDKFFTGTCQLTGTVSADRGFASGNYQCSDFSTGTWSSNSLRFTSGVLTAHFELNPNDGSPYSLTFTGL